jgi:hypothetical protein
VRRLTKDIRHQNKDKPRKRKGEVGCKNWGRGSSGHDMVKRDSEGPLYNRRGGKEYRLEQARGFQT